jgi:hypothetical protein
MSDLPIYICPEVGTSLFIGQRSEAAVILKDAVWCKLHFIRFHD